MWYFTADWHLGHSNIIKYCRRPFVNDVEAGLLEMADKGVIPPEEIKISPESTQQMTDTIIENTNAVVGPDDHLVIVGDFCWTTRDRRDMARQYRDRINCRNVFLIWGNHDDRKLLGPLFKGCYDQYVFNVNGQHIFTSHYPCRSWDMAHHGSWMLYGHVHNLYKNEDNGLLSEYQEKVFSDGFAEVLANHQVNVTKEMLRDLLDVVASENGIALTLDVGVDNTVRGDTVPWGTPWSVDEIANYMQAKKVRWDARKQKVASMTPLSTLKKRGHQVNLKF